MFITHILNSLLFSYLYKMSLYILSFQNILIIYLIEKMAPSSLLGRITTLVKPAVPVLKSYTEIYIAFGITGYLIWKIPITGSVLKFFNNL